MAQKMVRRLEEGFDFSNLRSIRVGLLFARYELLASYEFQKNIFIKVVEIIRKKY